MTKFNSEPMITFNLELMIKFQQSKWSYCCVFWNIVSHKFDVLSCFVLNAHWNKGSKPANLFNESAGVSTSIDRSSTPLTRSLNRY